MPHFIDKKSFSESLGFSGNILIEEKGEISLITTNGEWEKEQQVSILGVNMWDHPTCWGDLSKLSGKEICLQCRSLRRCRFDPWVGEISWRRTWQSTPIFLPWKSLDRGAWRAIVHRVAKSQTWLKLLSTHACSLKGPQQQTVEAESWLPSESSQWSKRFSQLLKPRNFVSISLQVLNIKRKIKRLKTSQSGKKIFFPLLWEYNATFFKMLIYFFIVYFVISEQNITYCEYGL